MSTNNSLPHWVSDRKKFWPRQKLSISMFGKTGQVAEFYEVPIKTVESALKCHRSEFVTLKSKVTNKTRHITIWNPRSTLMRSPNLATIHVRLEAVTGLNFKVANKAQNLTVRTAN